MMPDVIFNAPGSREEFLMPWGVERPIVEPYSGVRDIMVIPSLKTDEDGWFNLKNQMLALPSMLSEM